jgi:hypothetical protein
MAGPPPVPAPGDGRAPIESALPSPAARLLAFGAIVIAGICGGLIGWKVTELQVDDGSMLPGVVGLIGAAAAAGGVAVLSVLVLRAMGEWSTIVATGDPAAPRKRPS